MQPFRIVGLASAATPASAVHPSTGEERNADNNSDPCPWATSAQPSVNGDRSTPNGCNVDASVLHAWMIAACTSGGTGLAGAVVSVVGATVVGGAVVGAAVV